MAPPSTSPAPGKPPNKACLRPSGTPRCWRRVNIDSGGTMLQAADLTIRLNPADDVVIARIELDPGTTLVKEGNLAVTGKIPAGHKVAVREVKKGQPVRRYNQIIGFATRDIATGEHVHVHNVAMGDFERDYAFGADFKPVDFAKP